MQLSTIFVARAAMGGIGGELNILGMGVTRLSPHSLPWREPELAVVAIFEGEDVDLERDRDLSARIVDPEGELLEGAVLWTSEAEALRRQAEGIAPGEPRVLNFIGRLADAIFSSSGLHHIVIYVEGEEVGRVPLYVFEPEPEGDEADDSQPPAP